MIWNSVLQAVAQTPRSTMFSLRKDRRLIEANPKGAPKETHPLTQSKSKPRGPAMALNMSNRVSFVAEPVYPVLLAFFSRS